MNKKIQLICGIAFIVSCFVVFVFLLLSRPNPTPSNTPPTTPASSSTSDTNSEALDTIRRNTRSEEKSPTDTTEENKTSYTKNEQISYTDTGPKIVTSDGKTYPLRTYKPLMTPNDPYASQWWVTSTGLPSVWNGAAGAYQTTVAVIDTGVALQHQEFIGRWQTNSGEQGTTTSEAASAPNCSSRSLPLDKACNGIDDDKNGLIDDVRGWDFSNSDNSVQAGETNPDGTGTHHGTMVSGVLAATGNNGVGIAGVNWSTKILPIQAMNDDSYGDTLTVANSVRYAADQNADVISISLGSDAPDPYLREAIDYAIEAGSVVVAASGNEGCDCISYPANYPEVLAIGASNSSQAKSSFSNYGNNLDILAPGEDITTSTWTKTQQSNAYQSGVAGTSFSAPYVAGLLALAKSYQPNATWGELTAALTEESNHTGLSATAPFSSQIGFGYTRADTLIGRVTTPTSSIIRYQFGPMSVNDSLDTALIYQCEAGQIPTTRVYELTQGSALRFTISELARQYAIQNGWSNKRIFYSCVGLPGDTSTALRTINLPHEIYNRYDGK